MSICPIVFSKSLLYEFLNLSTGGLGPILISLWHDHRKPTEEWKLHFARKCLDRKRCIKHGKMNKALWLAHFFKMQMLIGCGTTARKCPLLTDSLAIPGHTYAYAWKWLFYLHFFCMMISLLAHQHNTVYLGVINYAKCVMVGSSGHYHLSKTTENSNWCHYHHHHHAIKMITINICPKDKSPSNVHTTCSSMKV